MCAACRTRLPKSDMIRMALDDDGILAVDVIGALRGRGVNICPREECLIKAIEIHTFDRVWSGVQQKSDEEKLLVSFRKVLAEREFRGGNKTVTYRVDKDKAEQQVGHGVIRAT